MLFLWEILIANFLNGDKLLTLRGEEPQMKGSFSSHIFFAFFLARSLSASSETLHPAFTFWCWVSLLTGSSDMGQER